MMNINCIICSDLISQTENIYFTKCGHVFHYHCLAQWIERSKSCPQCRNRVTEKCISRVYFNFANTDGIVEDAATLQSKLDSANFQLRQKETELRDHQEKIKTLEDKFKVHDSILKGTEKKLVSKETAILALKDQLQYCKVQNQETDRLRMENDKLEKSLNTLNGLQKVLNATADEVDRMLVDYTDVKILATFASALKSALTQAEARKSESRSQLQAMKTQLTSEKNLVVKLQAQVMQLHERLSNAEQKNKLLISKRKMSEATSDEQDPGGGGPHKLRKSSESGRRAPSPSPDLSREETLDMSINSLVKSIEDADSPYLRLKQGAGAGVATLRIRNNTLQSYNVKPSEIALLKPTKSVQLENSQEIPSGSKTQSQENCLSIFNKKKLNTSLDLFMDDMETVCGRLETSYDGLGGHSKPDVFPVPFSKSPLKTCIPKVTPKHRLKNPNPKTQGIGRFFEKLGNR